MDLSGLNLHALKGNRKGTYAVKVSGNWRVTFKSIRSLPGGLAQTSTAI
ncbi:MAG: hypothetical protein HGJ94_07220 [Desulfosarcina sp.]|nr:hypothetical protein [Desulfosarcina sp.]